MNVLTKGQDDAVIYAVSKTFWCEIMDEINVTVLDGNGPQQPEEAARRLLADLSSKAGIDRAIADCPRTFADSPWESLNFTDRAAVLWHHMTTWPHVDVDEYRNLDLVEIWEMEADEGFWSSHPNVEFIWDEDE